MLKNEVLCGIKFKNPCYEKTNSIITNCQFICNF